MQIGQNAKVLNINNPKYSILGVPIENQCVKGGGLLYGGFGLPIFGIFCILSGLHFVCFDVLSHLHFVKFAFCHGFQVNTPMVTMCTSTILSIYSYNICCVQLYLYAKVEYRYTAAMHVTDYLLYYIDTIPRESNMCLFLMYYIYRGSATILSRCESNVEWVIRT